MDLTLEDGLRLEVRPIRPGDKGLLVEGLRLMSPQSVYRRFLGPKHRFTSAELRYLTEVDGRNHVALIAVERERPQHIVGVARFVRDRVCPDTAEFAIAIGDAYQRRGAGRALSRLLVAEARKRGIRRFTATTAGDNVAAQRLIAGMSEHLEYVPTGAGAMQVVAELAAA